MEEYENAKAKLKYDNNCYHIAVCGSSGSEKSSFINAIRGLTDSPNEVGSAPVGDNETTTEIGRYPDPDTSDPIYKRMVWYDVPGAGTRNFPVETYFVVMGLYVFDFIIFMYDTRFTEVDCKVLLELMELCIEKDIPVCGSEQIR